MVVTFLELHNSLNQNGLQDSKVICILNFILAPKCFLIHEAKTTGDWPNLE